MKEKIIMLFFCVLFITAAKGQDITNGHFETVFTHIPQYTTPCVYFNYGFLPNWFRSHGTPDWVAPTTKPTNFNNCALVELINNNVQFANYGEGIVGGYTFKPGITYNIEIGIWAATGGTYELETYATNNLKQGDLCYTTLGTCVCPVPTLNPDGSPFQKEYIGNSGTLYPTSSPSTVSFTYTPSGNYDQFWIYITNGAIDIAHSFLDYVKIWPCTNGSVAFDDYSSPPNHVPTGLTAKRYIQTIGYSALTENDANNQTRLIGTGITLDQNFRASVNNDNSYFLAIAVPDCIELSEETFICEDGGGDEGQGKMGPQDITSLEQKSEEIRIYPNPVTDHINVQRYCEDDNEMAINIRNLNGQCIYKANVPCMKNSLKKHVINTEHFASGVYFIEVTFKDQHVIQKLVK